MNKLTKYLIKFNAQLGNVQTIVETQVAAETQAKALEIAATNIEAFLKLYPIDVKEIPDATMD